MGTKEEKKDVKPSGRGGTARGKRGARALSTRIDYFNDSASTVLEQIDSTRNLDYSVKQTGVNERGDIVARDYSGERESPTANYRVIAAGSIDVDMGTVNTVASVVYLLSGLNIKTSAGAPPEVTKTGESLQAGATVSSTIDVGAITISPRHKAQILASAFTLSGADCKLVECSLDVKCNVTRATKDGETLAHDVSGASIMVSGTVRQYGATEPTITAESGWEFDQNPTDTNPDEGYTEWTFTLVKDLTSTEPA